MRDQSLQLKREVASQTIRRRMMKASKELDKSDFMVVYCAP
jgi:hypothetical protein